MSIYLNRGRDCSNETVPNASWALDIARIRIAGEELELLSVFEIGTRKCLALSECSTWRSCETVEALDRVSRKFGYPRTIYILDVRGLYLDLPYWARIHDVDLQLAATMEHRIAERRLPCAIRAIRWHYNLYDGGSEGLASKLLAIMQSRDERKAPAQR